MALSDNELFALMQQVEGVPATEATQPSQETDSPTIEFDDSMTAILNQVLEGSRQEEAAQMDPEPAISYLQQAIESPTPLAIRQFDTSGKQVAEAVPTEAAKVKAKDDWYAQLGKELVRDEGSVLDNSGNHKVYKDSKNVPTVGYGFNLQRADAKAKIEGLGLEYKDVLSGKSTLTEEDAQALLSDTMKDAEKLAASIIPGYDKFSPTQQRALTNMTFQLGDIKKKGFTALIQAAEDGDIEEMAMQMADSKWAREDSPIRAARTIKLLLDGRAAPTVTPTETTEEVQAGKNPMRNEDGMKPIEPTMFQSIKDYVSDTYRALRYSDDYNLSRQALKLAADAADKKHLQPVWDSNGTFTGFRKESEAERITRRQINEAAAMKADKADSVGDAARITADIISTMSDPLALLTGGKAAQGAHALGRMARIGAVSATYAAGAETLRQVNEEVEFNGGDLATVTALAGVGGAVAGEVLVQGGRLAKHVWNKAAERVLPSAEARAFAADPRAAITHQSRINKEAGKIVDNLETKIQEYRAKGLNPGQSFHRAMRDERLLPEQLDSVWKKAGRKPVIDPEGHAAFSPSSGLRDGGFMSRGTTRRLADEFLGVISTRLGNYSPVLKARIRKFDFDVHARTQQYSETVEPFLVGLRQLPKPARKSLNSRLINQDRDGALQVLQQLPDSKMKTDLIDNFTKVSSLLKEVYGDLSNAGLESGYLSNFFPRGVKNYDKLLKALGSSKKSAIEKKILDVNTSRREKGLSPLSDAEKEGIINQAIRGQSAIEKGALTPKILKNRVIDDVTDDLLEHYDDAHTALANYLQYAAHTVEKAKLLGKNINFDDLTSPNTNATIAKWVRSEWAEGNITAGELADVTKLIATRFRGGDVTTNPSLAAMKNIFYMPTLGQPTSALTQLGDIGLAAYKNGVWNTLKALAPGVGTKINMKDIGLDSVAAEMASTGTTARMLNRVLRATGFKAMDGLGKRTVLSGAYSKHATQVSTLKGATKFAKENAHLFRNRDEVRDVIKALKEGRVTENVKFLLWNTLADMQPISLSEVPEKYLTNPNGRIFYMLKTFMIKQADIMRRDIIQEAEKGNYGKAGLNLGRFVALFTAANMSADSIKNFVTGRETTMSDLVVSNALKNFMMSDYLVSKVGKGDVTEALYSLVAPPLGMLDDIVEDIAKTGQQFESLQHAPGVGRLAYYWFGGGIEKEANKAAKAEKKELGIDEDLAEEMRLLNEEMDL